MDKFPKRPDVERVPDITPELLWKIVAIVLAFFSLDLLRDLAARRAVALLAIAGMLSFFVAPFIVSWKWFSGKERKS